jgi:hypothetical protein
MVNEKIKTDDEPYSDLNLWIAIGSHPTLNLLWVVLYLAQCAA